MAEQKVGPWARASGVALGVMVLAQLAIGFYLNGRYTPTPEGAVDSIRAIRDSELPRYLQNAHYWGSAWLIVHGFLHVFAMILTGSYRSVSKWAWLGAVGVFGCAFLMQVTGNLLPFDQHDVQTAVVEGQIAAGMPLLGEFSSTLLLNGKAFGPDTLRAWHQIHLLLIAPLAVGGLICLFGFPAGSVKAKPFVRFFWLVPLAVIAGLSLAVAAPWGEGATVLDYVDSAARPSWYTWPMHGALNAFEAISPGLGWIGAGVLPGLLAAVLLFAPWIGAKRDRIVRGAFLTLVGAFGATAILYGGSPAPAWGQQNTPPVLVSRDVVTPVDEKMAQYGFRLAKENCAGCHGKELKGERGFPDLTVQFKRRQDADYYKRFIKDPKGTKPGSRMPGFSHLSDDKIAALAEWLRQEKP